jgi:hypothetical protein
MAKRRLRLLDLCRPVHGHCAGQTIAWRHVVQLRLASRVDEYGHHGPGSIQIYGVLQGVVHPIDPSRRIIF